MEGGDTADPKPNEATLLMEVDSDAPQNITHSNEEENKKHVYVHVRFVKVADIDTIKESFDATVIIQATWREPQLDKDNGQVDASEVDLDSLWTPKLFIENVLGKPSVNSSRRLKYMDDQAFIVDKVMVQGRFYEALELWEFPFDVQDLTVQVMSDTDANEVELLDDPNEMHVLFKQSFYDAQEWYMYKHVESHKSERASNIFDLADTRPALAVTCKVARRPAFFLWNIFGVSLLVTCLAFVTFAIKPDLPQNRLQLSFVLVLTAVASKTAVNTYLPRISYLTYLDRHVLATIIMAAMTCFWHGIQTLLPHSTHEYDWVALVVLAGCYVLYLITFGVRVFRNPYKIRRRMHKEEEQYMRRLEAQPRLSPMKC